MTGRSTVSARWKPRPSVRRTEPVLALAFFLWALPAVSVPAEPQVVDQVTALVGKTPLTQRDVEVHDFFTRWWDGGIPPQELSLRTDPERFQLARQDLVRRTLIVNSLSGAGSAGALPEERLARMRQRLGRSFTSDTECDAFLTAKDLARSDLEAWAADRLRAELFLDRQLALRIQIADAEVKAYYEKEKEKRFLGKSYTSVENIVRADLQREKLKREFEGWLETETTRTEVILLPAP